MKYLAFDILACTGVFIEMDTRCKVICNKLALSSKIYVDLRKGFEFTKYSGPLYSLDIHFIHV